MMLGGLLIDTFIKFLLAVSNLYVPHQQTTVKMELNKADRPVADKLIK